MTKKELQSLAIKLIVLLSESICGSFSFEKDSRSYF